MDNGNVDSLLITNNNAAAPDSTQTADKLLRMLTIMVGFTYYRDYNLTPFETFDSGTVKFDSGTETFDTGATGIDATQTFTYSVFFKSAGLNLSDLRLLT